MSGSPNAAVESEAGGVKLEFIAESGEDPGIRAVAEHAGSVVVGDSVLLMVSVPFVERATVVAVVEPRSILLQQKEEAFPSGRIEDPFPDVVSCMKPSARQRERDYRFRGQEVESDIEKLWRHLKNIGQVFLHFRSVCQLGLERAQPALGIQNLHFHRDERKRAMRSRQEKGERYKTIIFIEGKKKKKRKRRKQKVGIREEVTGILPPPPYPPEPGEL